MGTKDPAAAIAEGEITVTLRATCDQGQRERPRGKERYGIITTYRRKGGRLFPHLSKPQQLFGNSQRPGKKGPTAYFAQAGSPFAQGT